MRFPSFTRPNLPKPGRKNSGHFSYTRAWTRLTYQHGFPSSMPRRTIAIGDIHGCSAALRTLVAAIEPTSEDTLLALGDYVDRGPDSKGVLEELLALEKRCRLV